MSIRSKGSRPGTAAACAGGGEAVYDAGRASRDEVPITPESAQGSRGKGKGEEGRVGPKSFPNFRGLNPLAFQLPGGRRRQKPSRRFMPRLPLRVPATAHTR